MTNLHLCYDELHMCFELWDVIWLGNTLKAHLPSLRQIWCCRRSISFPLGKDTTLPPTFEVRYRFTILYLCRYMNTIVIDFFGLLLPLIVFTRRSYPLMARWRVCGYIFRNWIVRWRVRSHQVSKCKLVCWSRVASCFILASLSCEFGEDAGLGFGDCENGEPSF